MTDRVQEISGITPGAFYALQTGYNRFQVVRVIAIEECGVHFQMYGKWYEEIPNAIDMEELQQTSTTYMPFRWWPFYVMAPEFLTQSPLRPEDMEAYRRWKKEDGMYWGD